MRQYVLKWFGQNDKEKVPRKRNRAEVDGFERKGGPRRWAEEAEETVEKRNSIFQGDEK